MEAKVLRLLSVTEKPKPADWGTEAYWEPTGSAWEIVFANVMFEDESGLSDAAKALLDNNHQTYLDYNSLVGIVLPGHWCTVDLGPKRFGANPDLEFHGRKVQVVGLRTSYEVLGG